MDIDIIEQELCDIDPALLSILLQDKTTKQNIKWATDNYVKYGAEYAATEEIFSELITGKNTFIIQPRVSKALVEQSKRTRDKAEVFTPSWVCNEQNNLIDAAWFGHDGTFNTGRGQTWVVNPVPVVFPDGKTWREYVDARRMEVSCGEAPYLVSRYDTVSGQPITIENRIGLLDRKLRIVGENTSTPDEWFKWALRAFQSTYAYEFQGDNLLLARENLLYTFLEYHHFKFKKKATLSQTKKIANVIAWNVWQMDAFTCLPPYAAEVSSFEQLTLFDEPEAAEAAPCRIFDWRSNRSLEFQSMLKGGTT